MNMEFLLAQGITETIEIKEESKEDPIGGGASETITIPIPQEPTQQDPVRGLPEVNVPMVDGLINLPVPKVPMGTIIETITLPAVQSPKFSTINQPVISTTKPQKNKIMFSQGESHEVKTESNGSITIKREICDGEVHLGPFKSCLKEFTGVPAVGWIAAAAGLIVLWKWLDYRFKK